MFVPDFQPSILRFVFAGWRSDLSARLFREWIAGNLRSPTFERPASFAAPSGWSTAENCFSIGCNCSATHSDSIGGYSSVPSCYSNLSSACWWILASSWFAPSVSQFAACSAPPASSLEATAPESRVPKFFASRTGNLVAYPAILSVFPPSQPPFIGTLAALGLGSSCSRGSVLPKLATAGAPRNGSSPPSMRLGCLATSFYLSSLG